MYDGAQGDRDSALLGLRFAAKPLYSLRDRPAGTVRRVGLLDLPTNGTVDADARMPALVRGVERLDRRIRRFPRLLVLHRSHILDAFRRNVDRRRELRRTMLAKHPLRLSQKHRTRHQRERNGGSGLAPLLPSSQDRRVFPASTRP